MSRNKKFTMKGLIWDKMIVNTLSKILKLLGLKK